MDLLPRVFNTKGNVVKFDPQKIFESIVKETSMDEEAAKHITELAVRRIISSGMQFLSGPHIREIVCSILSEQHFEQERKLYTRIGMPLMDYEAFLEEGGTPKSFRPKYVNPEQIHNWAASQIGEEYAHLRLLGNEQSRAHLYGDIHIHQLRHFDLRPMTQVWDPRMILKFGLPPIDDWSHCTKAGPAGNLKVAVNHLAKWLGITQAEFSGQQGFHFLCTFLAPYARDLDNKVIFQAMQNLIYEMNQLSILIGRKIPPTFFSCSPSIFPLFKNSPAIGKYGKEVGSYGEFQESCLRLFQGLNKIYEKGDYCGKPFNSPNNLIYLNEKSLELLSSDFFEIWDNSKKFNTLIFVNLNANWLKHQIERDYSNTDFFGNKGILQTVALNLPRYAYQSRSEEEFFETLREKMEMSSKILKIKDKIIQKRLESQHLPICSGTIDQKPLLELNQQKSALTFVGLNEAVKSLTGSGLHEDQGSFQLGIRIVRKMREICNELSKKELLDIILKEETSDRSRYRFAQLDNDHFANTIIIKSSEKGLAYSNSYHFPKDISMDILEKIRKESQFHPIIQNNVLISLSAQEIENIKRPLKQLVPEIYKIKEVGRFNFELQ